jgi:hypothetical protein
LCGALVACSGRCSCLPSFGGGCEDIPIVRSDAGRRDAGGLDAGSSFDAGPPDAGCTPLCDPLACGPGRDTCGREVLCECEPGSECGEGTCRPRAPVLYFSDLTSGPRTGWEGSDTLGAAVTVWGRHFGASPEVRVNGAVAEIAHRATSEGPPPLERITFFVPGAALDGPGSITIESSTIVSNELPFTVRDGRIFYVTFLGSDDFDGSWMYPWQNLSHAVAQAVPGDLIYVRDDAAFRTLELDRSGTAELPIAIAPVPGSTLVLGPSTSSAVITSMLPGGSPAEHWVLSGLRVTSTGECADARTGFRIVGSSFRVADEATGAACVVVTGDGVDVLGSAFVMGAAARDYAAIAARGTAGSLVPEGDRELAYNQVRGGTGAAIRIASDGAPIADHFVHDNAIFDSGGPAIAFGANVAGDHRVFTNLVVRAGSGASADASHAGLRFDLGASSTARVSVAFNTVYDAGAGPGALESGAIFLGPGGELILSNNVFASEGRPLVADGSTAPPPNDYRNGWLGDDAPLWDRAP